MGSISEAKKAPVENMDSAMDMLEAFMAPKNVIQCRAIIMPATASRTNALGVIFVFTLANLTYINIKTEAISIRYHTKAMALMLISSPKMAVNPAINTNK